MCLRLGFPSFRGHAGFHWFRPVMRDTAATVTFPDPGSLGPFLGNAGDVCQTQESVLPVDSPMLTLLAGYAARDSCHESHSTGRKWRTRLYFPSEPRVADFLAACDLIPVLSQLGNTHLLNSCFAWLGLKAGNTEKGLGWESVSYSRQNHA